MPKRLKGILPKALLCLIVAVVGIYGINATIIFLAQPANIQSGEKAQIDTQYGTIRIVLLDDLKAGGLGNLASGTTGYVNVLSPDPTIYLDGKEYDSAPRQNSYIYRHEMAHVLQKELIAKEVGGYPSLENPVLSFAYYYHLIKLNNDFAAVMPEGNHDAIVHSPFSGLEISADCFAQQIQQEEPLTYIGSAFCNDEQKTIAIAMLSERWPYPLSETEKSKK